MKTIGQVESMTYDSCQRRSRGTVRSKIGFVSYRALSKIGFVPSGEFSRCPVCARIGYSPEIGFVPSNSRRKPRRQARRPVPQHNINSLQAQWDRLPSLSGPFSAACWSRVQNWVRFVYLNRAAAQPLRSILYLFAIRAGLYCWSASEALVSLDLNHDACKNRF